MSNWDRTGFAQQGWQCPICKKVYSPTTPMCYYCGNGIPYTVSSTTVGDAKSKTKEVDIKDIDDLWCDDITFCQEECGLKSCPRNKRNIRDKTIPHSYSVEIPQDCPKKKGEMQG